jgi:hypothetical protein
MNNEKLWILNEAVVVDLKVLFPSVSERIDENTQTARQSTIGNQTECLQEMNEAYYY